MAPFEGHTGVDQAARAMAFVLGWNADIERSASRAPDDFHGLIRIASCRHRPENVILARRINVFIHHHDEAPVVCAAERLRGEKEGLARMPG